MDEAMVNMVRPPVGRAEVTEGVVGTLARMIGRDPGSVDPSLRFFEDLAFDSTSILEVLMHLENDLGVEFEPETLDPSDFETVGTLVDYVTRQLHGDGS